VELGPIERELATVSPFHPRIEVSALREDDLLAPNPLRRLLQRTGWWLDRYDDGPNRFLATAERVPGPLQSQDA